jgi:adenylate cyclase
MIEGGTHGSRASGLLEAFISIGDRPGDTDDKRFAHRYIITSGSLMAIGGIFWGALAWSQALYAPAIFPLGYTVITILNFLYFRVTKHFRVVRRVQMTISLLLPFLFQWSLGGFLASGAVMLWALVAVLGSLIFQALRDSLLWLTLYLALTIVSAVIDARVSVHAIELSPVVTVAFFAINIGLVSALAFFMNAYLLGQREKAKARLGEMADVLKRMFGRYLSTEVMNSMVENPASMELGGARRTVTIMMTDLRGFTAMAERMQPEQVVQILNTYFEVMVDVVLKYNGTINEIIGDALLVIYGAPHEMPDRAQRAIASAIEMQNAMAEVNAQNRAAGLPELEMGIGLNECEVIVGNIGSSKRTKYSVVGSGVNMASRIESYSVGGQILISESVRRLCDSQLRIDGQRDVLPKGAEEPIRIYEVGGISAPYNLTLLTRSAAMVTLAREIPLHCVLLEGKDAGGKTVQGSAKQLSRFGARVAFNAPLETMTNLKLSLRDVDEVLARKNFYGKVTQATDGSGEALVTFTSLPSEVDAYIQAHLQFGRAIAG